MSFSKTEVKTALKSSGTSFRQRGGQTAKKIGMEAPKYKMSALQTKKFLRESGMSKSGVREVMTELKQQKAPEQPQEFGKSAFGQNPNQREIKGQEPQKDGIKTPGWVEKVEKQGEIAPQKTFGKQIEEDVRLQKAGQPQQGGQRQPSSDVDRSRYSQSDVDRLEQKGQTEYYDKASQTSKFDKLDQAEEDNAAKIDAMLGGGGGGENSGGGEK